MLRFANTRVFRVFCLSLLFVLACAALAQAHGHDRPKKVGILLVAFGTSMPEAQKAYDVVDKLVKKEWPDIPVRWAYTSKMIRHKLAKEGRDIPSPAEALARMADEDFTHVAVQSLHVIPGEEYHGLVQTAHAFAGMPKGMRKVLVGYPLLATSEQLENVAKTILDTVAGKREDGQALILLGHGTHHPGDVFYAAMQYHFSKLDPTVLVGTVEGVPSLEDVQAALKKTGLDKAALMPLMAVAGDHAHNDMAGDEPDSWKSVLESGGVACTPWLSGMAGLEPLAQLWVQRLAGVIQHFD